MKFTYKVHESQCRTFIRHSYFLTPSGTSITLKYSPSTQIYSIHVHESWFDPCKLIQLYWNLSNNTDRYYKVKNGKDALVLFTSLVLI